MNIDQEMKKRIIGQRIRQRRKALGMTQEDLAEKMGVNKSSIMRYEKGQMMFLHGTFSFPF